MIRAIIGTALTLCILSFNLFPDQAFGQKTEVFQSENYKFNEAKVLFDHKKYVVAQKGFEKAIKSYGENNNSLQKQEAEYYEALCAYELFNRDAEQLLLEFLNSHPENPKVEKVRFIMGCLKYRTRKFKDAIAWFSKVDVLKLNNEEIAEYHFKKGYSYFKQRDHENAKASFFEIKNADTKYTPLAIYYYGHLSYIAKKYETALIEFKKLTTDKHFKKIVPYYITQIYYLQEKFDDVLTYAPRLLDTSKPKRSADISRLIADSYYKSGDYKNAAPYFEKFLKLTNKITRQDYYQLGFAYYKNAHYKEAIVNFKKLVYEKDSLTQFSHYHMAACYIKLDNKKFARNSFSACTKLKFDDKIREDALFNFAKLSYEHKYNPFQEAISAFQDFIEQYPKSTKVTKAYEYMVSAYLTTNNYKLALQSLEKVKQEVRDKDIKLQQAYQMLAYNRGIDLYNNNELKKSIVHFEKALIYPLDKSINLRAHFWKAEAHFALERYEECISEYEVFYKVPGAASSDEFVKAHYNQGYAFFQKKDYASAILRLRQFTKKADTNNRQIISDAYLRIGDSYFIAKDGHNAIDYYNLALHFGIQDEAYTVFQKSMALGILRKFDEKIALLESMIGKYEKSIWIDDVKFQLASSLMIMNKTEEAQSYFEKVVAEYPTSSYVKKSLLKIAVIDFNNNKDDEAIKLYKQIAADYPETPEAKIAFDGIEKIYIANSNIDGWMTYLKNIGKDVPPSRLDSATYHAAENGYIEGDCEKAILDFGNYLSGFPSGVFMLQAQFYRSECFVRRSELVKALTGYTYVLSRGRTKFYEKALRRSADINMELKYFNEAKDQYIRLESISEYPENVLAAVIGQMRINFKLKEYTTAIEKARVLLSAENVDDKLVEECHFVIAKSAFALEDLVTAIIEFKHVTTKFKTEKGAEAQYHVAYIQYLQNELDSAEASITELVYQVPSYDFWISKGMILLAEIYAKKDDAFQAKHILQSIIEKSQDSVLVSTAEIRLLEIVEAEEQARIAKEKELEENREKTEMVIDESDEQEQEDVIKPEKDKDGEKEKGKEKEKNKEKVEDEKEKVEEENSEENNGKDEE
ncbi:MAG: tetratricopeptide repeat protein [Flavobacteriales bacterium]|nr:tetratricopeptide repeat protein [Flavobacteriales bacterium]